MTGWQRVAVVLSILYWGTVATVVFTGGYEPEATGVIVGVYAFFLFIWWGVGWIAKGFFGR